MAKSKLIQALEILTPAQKSDLSVFLRMPSNKLSSRNQELLQLLLDQNVNWNECSETQFWETHLQREEKSKRNSIKNKLLEVLDRFCLFNSIQADLPMSYTLMARFYLENGVPKNGFSWLKKAQGILGTEEDRTLNRALYQFWLHELEVNASREKRIHTGKVDQMQKALEEFYHINKTRIYCEKLNRGNIVKTGEDLEQLRSQLESPSDSIEGRLYFDLSRLLLDEETDKYESIEQVLEKQKRVLTKKYRKEIIEYLMNFCIRKTNQGDKFFAEAYLRLVGVLKAEGMWLNMGKLSLSRFKNYIVASIIADNIEWGRSFFDQYKYKLEAPKKFEKKPFLNFNLAIVEFYSGHWQDSRKLLTDFKNSNMYSKDIYHKIACDKLLLKIDFELRDFEFLGRDANRISRYIDKHPTLPRSRKAPHLQFIQYFKALIKEAPFDLETNKGKLLILDYKWLKKHQGQQGAIKGKNE